MQHHSGRKGDLKKMISEEITKILYICKALYNFMKYLSL